MPKGVGPYDGFCREAWKSTRSRGVFIYVMEGQLAGDGWSLYAPSNVAQRFPSLLEDAANDILTMAATPEGDETRVDAEDVGHAEQFNELAEAVCKGARAGMAFVYVLEGADGQGWAMYAPPSFNLQGFSELLRGLAEDLQFSAAEPGGEPH